MKKKSITDTNHLAVCCSICGRPLKTAGSREHRLGPVCRHRALKDAATRQGELFTGGDQV